MRIVISVAEQRLDLFDDQKRLLRSWPVSTAANGLGQLAGSFCTPTGRHYIRAKIGDGLPDNAVLVARRPTGEVFCTKLSEEYPERDWILTRILWLSGCEPGHNRLGLVDTMRRFIYIHGSPDTVTMGRPGSHGCIRMSNPDVRSLFDQVSVGTIVDINEK